MKGQLQSLHEKIDQLLLASKASSSEAYSKVVVGSLFECITKEHVDNDAKRNKAMTNSTEGMDALAVKTEKVRVLGFKLENAEKKVKDLLSERAVIRSCISDVTSLLSDIIKTRALMITITVRKHLAEKLRHVFDMLHRLEGVSPQNSNPK
ncbi:unnamed protein product [Lactuca saligna]|uniref:Uncharacterized protein n=1 Tax=Lactuca saligna TaxID=75948 RepID=A0AA36E206_LACSI|nr:unnamed protein product [Lactuca saligna]